MALRNNFKRLTGMPVSPLPEARHTSSIGELWVGKWCARLFSCHDVLSVSKRWSLWLRVRGNWRFLRTHFRARLKMPCETPFCFLQSLYPTPDLCSFKHARNLQRFNINKVALIFSKRPPGTHARPPFVLFKRKRAPRPVISTRKIGCAYSLVYCMSPCVASASTF